MGDKKNENAKLYKEVFANKELRNFFIILRKYYEIANKIFLKRYEEDVKSLNEEYESEITKFQVLEGQYMLKSIGLRSKALIPKTFSSRLYYRHFTFKGISFSKQDVALLQKYIDENKNSNIEIKVEFSIEKNYNKLLEEKNLEEYEKLKNECEKLKFKLERVPKSLLSANFWDNYNYKLAKLHLLELKLEEENTIKEEVDKLKSFTFYELNEINTFFTELGKFNKFSESCSKTLYELKKKRDNEQNKFKYTLELLRDDNLSENYEYIKDKFLSCDTIAKENTKGILTGFDRKKYLACKLDINLIDLFLEYLIEEKNKVNNIDVGYQKKLIKK